MFYVYILKLSNNSLYKGKTKNLKRRLSEHVHGYVTATKNKRPLQLIYYEAYANSTDCNVRENYLKTGHGRHDLKKQLKHTIQDMASSSNG